MAFVLRQLGATVGHNLQCAQDAVPVRPAGSALHRRTTSPSRPAPTSKRRDWSGQYLHVGPVRLESGCKIGMRAAVADNVTVGRGTWITPFTPILSDVGSQEMWEGAPARRSGRCTELKRTANTCRYARPIWLLETAQRPDADLHLLLAQSASRRRHPVARAQPHTGRRSRACRRVFQGGAAIRDRLAPDALRVHHHLGRRRRRLSC